MTTLTTPEQMRKPTFRKWADWLCNFTCLLIFLLAVLGTALGWLH